MDTRTESQPAESIREQLRQAEANLKAATANFRALRRAAFAGRYDPDAFDQAVLSCRAAEAALLAARHAMATGVKEPEATGQPAGPLAPTLAALPPGTPVDSALPPDGAPSGSAPASSDTPQGVSAGEPDPLARLRFARWLVQTGRLSEQIAA